MIKTKAALIMVDLQNDFCAGGALAVPDADAIIPLANELQLHFDLVVATQDWHPEDHLSFAVNHPGKKVGDVILLRQTSQVLWPAHCVQNTKGAEFHPKLNTEHIQQIFHKGTDRFVDSYSAFFDNEHFHHTGLEKYLLDQNISDIFIIGLATDFCVKYTCFDAIKLNFNTHVIFDVTRGVELKPGDTASALREMQVQGAQLITMADVVRMLQAKS